MKIVDAQAGVSAIWNTSTRRVHYSTIPGVPVCGIGFWDINGPRKLLTRDLEQVTCGNCRRISAARKEIKHG